jgi:hypothetical protein
MLRDLLTQKFVHKFLVTDVAKIGKNGLIKKKFWLFSRFANELLGKQVSQHDVPDQDLFILIFLHILMFLKTIGWCGRLHIIPTVLVCH